MDSRTMQFVLLTLCVLVGSGLGTAKTLRNVKTSLASSGGGPRCVAIKGASNDDLQTAINYACGEGGADCSQIQPGGSCFEPNTLPDHSSYAVNDYYQKHPIPSSCVFGGTTTLTNTDPSKGKCHYASSSSASTSPPTAPSPPSPPTHDSPPSTPAFSTTPPPYTSGSERAFLSLSLLFASSILVSLSI